MTTLDLDKLLMWARSGGRTGMLHRHAMSAIIALVQRVRELEGDVVPRDLHEKVKAAYRDGMADLHSKVGSWKEFGELTQERDQLVQRVRELEQWVDRTSAKAVESTSHLEAAAAEVNALARERDQLRDALERISHKRCSRYCDALCADIARQALGRGGGNDNGR